MAASRNDIFQKALELREIDRVDLIGALIRSLDSATEAGVEAAWHAEIERRGRELESGAVQSIPWDLVRERLSRSEVG